MGLHRTFLVPRSSLTATVVGMLVGACEGRVAEVGEAVEASEAVERLWRGCGEAVEAVERLWRRRRAGWRRWARL